MANPGDEGVGMTTAQVNRRTEHAHTDPLSREALFRQVGSLVGAVILGLLSMAVRQVPQSSVGTLLQASTLTAITVIATVLIPWQRLPAFAHRVIPFAYLLVIFMACRATGGAASNYGQLALLPIIWVGVYGNPREVGVTSAGAAVMLGAPLLGTDALGWMQALGLLFVGTALGLLVNRFFSRIRSQTSQLQILAGTDPLTGAANRRAWDAELQGSLVRARRNGRPVSLILLDLDDFKGYNDQNGHQAGDILLKEAAAAWQNLLRASDILARIGGDEFGVLLPGCHLDMAATIAERLRSAIPTAKCSVGVVGWNGSETAEQLFARTDAALYDAKEHGKNQVVVIVPDLGTTAPDSTGLHA